MILFTQKSKTNAKVPDKSVQTSEILSVEIRYWEI